MAKEKRFWDDTGIWTIFILDGILKPDESVQVAAKFISLLLTFHDYFSSIFGEVLVLKWN